MEQFHFYYRDEPAGISIEQSVYRIGSYHYNWHREMELLLMLRGEMEVCSQAAIRVLKEDDLILINPNSGHATFSLEPESIAMVLHVDPRFYSRYYDDAEKFRFLVCSDRQSRNGDSFCTVRRYLAQIAENLRGDDLGRRLAIDSAFYGLMQLLMEVFPPERVTAASFQADEKKQEALTAVLKYIQKNYRSKISLDSLADSVGYNASYLSQLFKTNLGINFYDYLTRIRLREATRRLSQTDDKILDIALEYGFSNLKSFNNVFRKVFRKSPSEYRSLLSEDHALSDIAFKKEFLPADDPLIQKKLEEYLSLSLETQREAAAGSRREERESLHEQAQELLRKARSLAAEAECLEKALALPGDA